VTPFVCGLTTVVLARSPRRLSYRGVGDCHPHFHMIATDHLPDGPIRNGEVQQHDDYQEESDLRR
jgi:hypothetical protein